MSSLRLLPRHKYQQRSAHTNNDDKLQEEKKLRAKRGRKAKKNQRF